MKTEGSEIVGGFKEHEMRSFNGLSKLLLLTASLTVSGLSVGATLTRLSIPVNSMDAACEPRNSGVWSVTGNPVPNNLGIGWLVNPVPNASGWVLHDHQYVQDYVPDSTRAVVTFRFDEPVYINSLTVIQHRNGLTKLEGFSGQDLSAMTSVGNVFSEKGDITGGDAFAEFEPSKFTFNRNTSGRYFQVIVRKTSLINGYACYRMYLDITPISETNFEFSLNKVVVAGQNSVQGTLLLDEAAPMSTAFTISSSTTLVTPPAKVWVSPGQTIRNFYIGASVVMSPVMAVISAKRGTIVRSQSLLLSPLVPTAMAFLPSPVIGGQDVTCRLVINGVAGPGGRVISIFDSSTYATTPNTVTVPPGATQVVFPIITRPVASTQTVLVTARVSAGEKTGTFRILPPQ